MSAWIFNKTFIHLTHCLLHKRVIADAVLSHLDVVGGVPDEEMRGVGEEDRRHCRESVTDGKEIDVVLAARGQHAAYHRMRSVGDIRFAVVEYQKAMLEMMAHLLDVVKLVSNDTSCTFIRRYPRRKLRMHKRNIKPLVLVRCHHQGAATGFKVLFQDPTQNGRLAGARSTDKDGLIHRPKLRLLRLRLRWNRRCCLLCFRLFF